MTTEREMLEAAAKACGIKGSVVGSGDLIYEKDGIAIYWNPLANGLDTAEMCAKLGICTLFFDSEQKVSCGFLAQDKGPTLAHIEPYGDSRLKAWMFAATMVAAKIGGMK